MILRWIYQIWRIFWYGFLGLLTALILAGLVLYVSLQRNQVQQFLAHRVEDAFNANYKGHISIGSLGGDIPFNIILTDVRLTYDGPDDRFAASSPVFECDSLEFSVNLWDLIRRRINITRFDIKRPVIRLTSMGDSTYTLFQALGRRKDNNAGSGIRIFKDMNIYAPQLQMEEGRMRLDRLHHTPPGVHLPAPLNLEDVNMQTFLELTNNHRFIDIDHFHARILHTLAGHIDVSGQFYNDRHMLEFNRFMVKSGRSQVEINGRINGVNLYKGNWIGQARDASYQLSLDSSRVYLNDFTDIFPDLPKVDEPFIFNVAAAGDLQDLQFQKLHLRFNRSLLAVRGWVKNLNQQGKLAYNLTLDTLRVSDKDLRLLPQERWSDYFKDWDRVSVTGSLKGNEDSLAMAGNAYFPSGRMHMNGHLRFKEPCRYTVSLTARNILLDSLKTFGPLTGVVNVKAQLQGEGIRKDKANARLSLAVTDSRINRVPIDRLTLKTSLSDGFLEQTVRYQGGGGHMQGSGWLDLTKKEPAFSFSGRGSDLDLQTLFPDSTFPSTRLNISYNLRAQGRSPDSLYGEANLDIDTSLVAGKQIPPQQIYLDLDSPAKSQRTLRLASTYLDATLKGTVIPSRISRFAKYWAGYFREQVRKEVLFEPDSLTPASKAPNPPPAQPLNLNIDLHLKNLAVLHNYFPDFPHLTSRGHLQTLVKADSSRMLITGGWRDDLTRFDSVQVHHSQLMWTAGFSHNQSIREYANLDIRAQVDTVRISGENMNGLNWTFSMRDDSISNRMRIDRIGKNVQVNLQTTSLLSDSAFATYIDDFVAGNQQYAWVNDGRPEVLYNDKGHMVFKDFRMKNGEQFINLKGTYGPKENNSLVCTMRKINLQRVSDLLNGDVNFQGTLDAQFATHSLNIIRGLQGRIDVDRLSIDHRLLGDFSFDSKYDPYDDRFNTIIKLQTDTVKYHDYYERNNHIVNNITLQGYFVPPDSKNPADTLYRFQADFKSIDMWAVNYIIPGIFTKIEGRSNGTGIIWGDKKDYHFHADFHTHSVHVVPVFVGTDLYLTGPITIDRKTGVTFDNIDVADNGQGRGLFFGNIDLNNFQPTKPLDLTLRLYGLQFLDNKFDSDVPFYGSVSGTGTLRLTGTNDAPFLQTPVPITTTSSSKLSIPILDQTTVEDQNSFIRFVKEFHSGNKTSGGPSDSGNAGNANNENEDHGGRSFSQLFQLDLRFNVPQNSTVEFVFDPVTGEILTARGGGRINIALEDQILRMYGRFDISGGNYMFVAGDIFSRLFYLQSGGTIMWDGDPTNPKINISAYYQARPSLQPITGEDTRVPIYLMLQLQGNIRSLTNNFYFQYPTNSFDIGTTNSAVLSLLNSENQKLLQATSLLLTGNFTPLANANQNGTQALGANLQNYAAGIGIGQILSSQINTLLNSNLSNLNVNLSMNSFQEADLAIALRLFNDRLILSREGLISGQTQNDIGDLGAEYRINRSLSVQIFHRLDPTLSNAYGAFGNTAQLPSVNGIGLQYKVSFNSWNDLPNQVAHSFTSIFSNKNRKKQAPPDTTAVNKQIIVAEPPKENN